MIDAENLRFAGDLEDARVERLGRRQVRTERFLDHEPAKRAVRFLQQTRSPEVFGDGAEEAGRNCEIEDHVPAQAFGELCVVAGILEVEDGVFEPPRDPAPGRLIDLIRMKLGAGAFGEALQRIVEFGAPAVGRAIVVIEADDLQLIVEQLAAGEVVDGRHQEAFGEIADRTENGDRTRRRCFSGFHALFFHENGGM